MRITDVSPTLVASGRNPTHRPAGLLSRKYGELQHTIPSTRRCACLSARVHALWMCKYSDAPLCPEELNHRGVNAQNPNTCGLNTLVLLRGTLLLGRNDAYSHSLLKGFCHNNMFLLRVFLIMTFEQRDSYRKCSKRNG